MSTSMNAVASSQLQSHTLSVLVQQLPQHRWARSSSGHHPAATQHPPTTHCMSLLLQPGRTCSTM
jgi:hypothetical protein